MPSSRTLVSTPTEQFAEQLDLLFDRSLKTRACLDALAAEAAAEKAAKRRLLQRWLIAKRATLAALFALSFLQYHTLNVCVEIASLRSVAIAHSGSRLPPRRLPGASMPRNSLLLSKVVESWASDPQGG